MTANERNRPSPPAEIYDERYYLSGCEGAAEFVEFHGAVLTPARARALARVADRLANARVLDVGAGRGELVRAVLQHGARLSVGVDFSPAAVSVAKSSLTTDGAALVRGDARSLPFLDGTFDVVLSTDVIEHLTPAEAARMLDEIRRVLVPGGVLVVHTTPNRWWQQYGYYLFYVLSPTHRRFHGTIDARKATADPTHVNEQTPRSLARAIRAAGLSCRVELDDFNLDPANPIKRAAVRMLTRTWPLRLFCANHLFAVAVRPAAPEKEAPDLARDA